MIILAIDPGNEESAYVIFGSRLGTTESKILAYAKIKNDEMLRIISDVGADVMVVEMIASYGMSVGATVFETCTWIGRFEQHWIDTHAAPRMHERLKRMEVKMHLCHNPRAKDGNIRQALIDRFGHPGTKANKGKLYGVSGDVWAALAVAVTYADKQTQEQ